MYKAAVFDLDGTLLNTLEDIAASVNHTMEKYGFPRKTLDEVRMGVGNGGRKLMERCLPMGAEQPGFEEILTYYSGYYQAHCAIETKPYDGIMPMLETLKNQGVKMAIVSNKGDGAVKALAEEHFRGLIDQAVGEREGIRRKPCPDTVLEAMRLLGCGPEETLYVGDSDVDYHTAANAGIHVALVTWGFRNRGELEALQPEHLIDRAQQLCGLFAR